MKAPISEELLSAYFDGELSSKERVEVERWLLGNPEARQKVVDYRRLSRMFEGLSRTEVPQEFSTEVMQLAERRMLLPDASAPSRRIRIKTWWLATAAVAAAALLLVLNVSNRELGPPGKTVATLDPPSAHEVTMRSPAPSNGDSPWIGDGEKKQEQFVLPATGHPTHDTPSTDASGPHEIADSKAPAIENSIAVAPDATGTSLESDADLQVAAVVENAILGAQELDSNDRPISVVSVYTDDADGLTLLRKVCEDNQIFQGGEPESKSGGNDLPPKGGSASSAVIPTAEALCIVVTAPDQIVRALSEMMRGRQQAVRIVAQEPTIVAALDKVSQQRFAQAEEDVSRSLERFMEQGVKDSVQTDPRGAAPVSRSRDEGRNSDSPVGSRKSDAKPQPAGGPLRRGSAGGGPGAIAKKLDRIGAEKIESRTVKPPVDSAQDVQVAPEDEMSTGVVSRQLTVPRPPELQNRPRVIAADGLRQRNSQRPSAGQNSVTSNATTNAAGTVDQKKDSKETEALQAPSLVRMLIVIERESPQLEAAPDEPKNP